MGRSRLLLVVAVGCALVACNMLTGADELSSANGSSQDDVTSSSGGSSGTSGTTRPPPPPAVDGGDHHGTSSGATPPPPPSDAGADANALDAGATGTQTFFDDFSRPDGPIGNGWILKTTKFGLASGQVAELDANSTSYKDLLVLRPTSEDVANVEIRVDATIPSGGGDTCLYARVQPASSTMGSLVSYTFYPGGSNVAYLDHDIGTANSLPITSIALNPPLSPPQTIHMMLRVTGTSPVHIVASISDSSGKVLGALSVDDTTASPITAAGQVAFGSGGNGAKFDDFKVVAY